MLTLHPLYRSTLGFDGILDELERLSKTNLVEQEKFPPHNIIKVAENKYLVELSVAGYDINDISVEVKDNVLTIQGSKTEEKDDRNYIHKGIASRAFSKTIKLIDTVHVHGAEYVNGILRIALENIIPEHKLPRKIEITNNLSFEPVKQLLTEDVK